MSESDPEYETDTHPNIPKEPDHVKREACDICGAPVRYDGVCENEDCPHKYEAGSDSKYTPAPWQYEEDSDNYTHIVRSSERFVVQLPQHSSDTTEANARLIAAAPTMKERLMRLNTMLSWYLRPDVDHSPKEDEIREMLQWTEDAIAKAEGRNE